MSWTLKSNTRWPSAWAASSKAPPMNRGLCGPIHCPLGPLAKHPIKQRKDFPMPRPHRPPPSFPHFPSPTPQFPTKFPSPPPPPPNFPSERAHNQVPARRLGRYPGCRCSLQKTGKQPMAKCLEMQRITT